MFESCLRNYHKIKDMEQSFIDIGLDPTSPLNLSREVLEAQYESLTDEEKLSVYHKLVLKANHRICDIETFIKDDYFLGLITQGGKGIYDYWKDTMKKMYPSPVINRYPYVSLGGAIGIGKSTFSRICALYTEHKLDCLINPWKTFGLMSGKPITMMFSHMSISVVEREFLEWFKDNKSKSPYFRNMYNNHNIAYIASGLRDQNSLGSDLIFAVLSEVNFTKPQPAIDKINTAVIRYKARFQKNRHFIGNIIVDSSASPVSEHNPQSVFENDRPREELIILKAAHWEVKKKDYVESKGRTFDVYLGDSKTPPYILGENQKLPGDQDQNRIMKVPIQLKSDFTSDLRKAISDLGGKNISSGNLFFDGNISHLLNCCTLENHIPDTIHVDFYDKTQDLYEQIYPMIIKIPAGTFLHVHLDLGLVTDHTGISAVYFDHWDTSDGITKEPYFVCPFTVSVDRIKGQQTSLWHIYQFLLKLSREYNICVSADQFSSKQILQDLEREGVQTRYISVDKTDTPAIYLKNTINRERIRLPYNQRLLRECSDLQVVIKGSHLAIDHPKIASLVFDNETGEHPEGSKDVFDSLQGALENCRLSLYEGLENGVNTSYLKQTEIIRKMTKDPREESQKIFQNMLESIF